MINMVFPTLEHRNMLDNIFKEFNSKNRKNAIKKIHFISKKVYARTAVNFED